MVKGNFLMVLHSHLPWVLNHGNWPHGQDWLMEAAAECYIPLINIFHELVSDDIHPGITMDISPVLCEQLAHAEFPSRFIKYCDTKIAKAKEDEEYFKTKGADPHHVYLTQFWQQWFNDRKNNFLFDYKSDIINALRQLQDNGHIEIATCGATHGYLPLLATDESVNLQIGAAVDNYQKHFGRRPRGIWLPECAYRPAYEWKSLLPISPFNHSHLRPGIEQVLAKHGINYFFTDADLTARATPIGVKNDWTAESFVSFDSVKDDLEKNHFRNMELKPFHCSSGEQVQNGTAIAFTRDHSTALNVWSGAIGYPASPDYLDFHKKHYDSILRYWRVTDNKADMMYKTLYHPDWAREKVGPHANHYATIITERIDEHYVQDKRTAALCTPFDTELFGHWWFEGPEFIRDLMWEINHSPTVNAVTCSEHLDQNYPYEVMALPEGSWGENNNHDVWSNEHTAWTWVSIYDDENRMRKLSELPRQRPDDERLKELVTTALRQLMLEQSSDWQFLINNGTALDYASQRLNYHHSDFNRVCDIAEKYFETQKINDEDQKFLIITQNRNNAFAELDLKWWAKPFE